MTVKKRKKAGHLTTDQAMVRIFGKAAARELRAFVKTGKAPDKPLTAKNKPRLTPASITR
jgi:hypothetical protein